MYLADKIKDFNEANNADKVLSESFGREAKSRFAYFAYWFRIGLVLFWLVSCLLLTGCGTKDSDGWQIGKSLDPQIVESYINKDISNFRFYEKEVGAGLFHSPEWLINAWFDALVMLPVDAIISPLSGKDYENSR